MAVVHMKAQESPDVIADHCHKAKKEAGIQWPGLNIGSLNILIIVYLGIRASLLLKQ